MTTYNAKHPYEPDWQIPRGVWENGLPSDMNRNTAFPGEQEHRIPTGERVALEGVS